MENRWLFEQDPQLWVENFPREPLAWLVGQTVHGLLLRASPSYRYLAAVQVDWDTPRPPTAQLWGLAEAEQRALEAEAIHARVPLVYLNTPQMFGEPPMNAEMPWIELGSPDQPPGYGEVHPAPEHLQAWAEVAARGLRQLDLLPAPDLEHRPAQNNE